MTKWQHDALMLPEPNVVAEVCFFAGAAIILCAVAVMAWRLVQD